MRPRKAPIEAVVVLSQPGRGVAETEKRVRSLEELYQACLSAPPAALVRVALIGPAGEVRLHFGSLIPPAGGPEPRRELE